MKAVRLSLKLALLFAPACLAVILANTIADLLNTPLSSLLGPILDWLNTLPGPLASIFAKDYGIVAMFPFLLLYALPTILIFSALVGIYKSIKLIERLSHELHGLLRPFGIGGHELVRILMGFGCNVPAVIATRSCSSCTRGSCVSAISFGSACSYQLPATLAVFAAVNAVWLGPVYLGVLAVTTLIYLRLTRPTTILKTMALPSQASLQTLRPLEWKVVGSEVLDSMRDFFQTALPIFALICIAAGLLEWTGALLTIARLAGPMMGLFDLPPEAALAVILGSVRKDGIAIGLLNTDWQSLKVPLESPSQILTAVYLAGVLLPCLVTVITVAREMRPSFALKMLGRQALYAALFSLCIAWVGNLFFP